MYFPVLHARQSERLAIIAVSEKLKMASNVRPLLIPVRDAKKGSGSGLRGTVLAVEKLSKHKIPFFMLTTPYAKHVEQTQKVILDAINKGDKNKMAVPVVAVTATKPLVSLKTEIGLLGGQKFGVLHVSGDDGAKIHAALDPYKDKIVAHFFYSEDCDQDYCDHWDNANRILIADGFTRRPNNAAYNEKLDEDFPTPAYEYAKLGFDGYGDHTIVGESFTPGGGLPNAIALHLTYPSPLKGANYDEIRVRHFLSDHDTKKTPESTRFFEALEKLVSFYRSNKKDIGFSTACAKFEDCWTRKHYPKLAVCKQLSIEHHIELMSWLDL